MDGELLMWPETLLMYLNLNFFKKNSMKKAIVVASMFLAVAVVSCKKDDDKQVTSAELLTSTTWKIDTLGWDMDKNGSIDERLALEECELDNTLTFSSDSTGVFDEGVTKCDAADPQSSPFQWSLNDSTKTLTIIGNIPGELEGDVKILTLDNTTLLLSKNIKSNFPIQFDGNLIVSLKK